MNTASLSVIQKAKHSLLDDLTFFSINLVHFNSNTTSFNRPEPTTINLNVMYDYGWRMKRVFHSEHSIGNTCSPVITSIMRMGTKV